MDEGSGAFAQLSELDKKIHQRIYVPVESPAEKHQKQERQVSRMRRSAD